MIFDELRKIQDNPSNEGYLPQAELRSLAQRTGTPLYQLQEVASFFPHFHLERPAKVQVKVCRDMSCHLRGAPVLVDKLQGMRKELDKNQLSIAGVSCLGRCDRGPVACVNDHYFSQKGIAHLPRIIRDAAAGKSPPSDGDPELGLADPGRWQIDPYQGSPRYQAVRDYVARPDPDSMLKRLETADLLGMGGAGTPAARKWADVRQAVSPDGQKYIVCNGDESEPGTFKDREILLRTPHLVVEGMTLAGLVTGATRGFVFIRHEYEEQIHAVRAAIAAAEQAGCCGPRIFDTDRSFSLEVFVSPGGYICGEQGALIETIEGHRAQPRNRPPQLETNGLWNRPTLLNNVETFAWAVPIAVHGGEWYRDQGMSGCKGRRFFSVSGDVKRPAAYEVPIGISLGALINDLAGGTLDGRPPLAIAPSGPSGGFIPAQLPLAGMRVPESIKSGLPADASHINVMNLPLDLNLFRQMGLMLGAGIVVYGSGRNMLEQAAVCTRFFRNESCGKCVPCRLGSQKLVEIADALLRPTSAFSAATVDPLVSELAKALEMTSICGLGVSAPNPLVTWSRYFQQRAGAAGG